MLLSINVSPLQLLTPTLHDAIVHALSAYEVAPATLQLEFTEAAVLKHKDEAIASLQALKAIGVKIALDDFGKGYANLSCLRLPLDAIKIDQKFVHDLASDPASAAITDAIIALGKSLGLRVIAGGIESAQILALLRDKDCRQMQGYYVCPPVAAAGLEDWYHRWQAGPERFSQPIVH